MFVILFFKTKAAKICRIYMKFLDYLSKIANLVLAILKLYLFCNQKEKDDRGNQKKVYLYSI